MKFRLFYKIIFTFVAFIVMQVNYCSAGCASDDMQIPPPKLPNMDLAQSGQVKPPDISAKLPDESLKAPTALTSTEIIEKTEEIEKVESITEIEKPQQKNNGFAALLSKMFRALARVILLLMLIYGLIRLYKKFKNRQSKPLANQTNLTGEPQTVSEAVSGYIKLRIK